MDIVKSQVLDGIEVIEVNGAPVIKDIALADALGYERPRAIRQLIERLVNQGAYGTAAPRGSSETGLGGTATVYYLDEKQALLTIAKSETAKKRYTISLENQPAKKTRESSKARLTYQKAARIVRASGVRTRKHKAGALSLSMKASHRKTLLQANCIFSPGGMPLYKTRFGGEGGIARTLCRVLTHLAIFVSKPGRKNPQRKESHHEQARLTSFFPSVHPLGRIVSINYHQ